MWVFPNPLHAYYKGAHIRMSDFQTGMAANGLTAALLAFFYGMGRVLQRAKCHSTSGCCEIDIERAEREETERHEKNDTIARLVLERLRENDDIEEGGGGRDEGGRGGGEVIQA